MVRIHQPADVASGDAGVVGVSIASFCTVSTLAPSHAVVAGITRNSLALSRALLRDGLLVTVAETHSTDRSLGPMIEELRAAGALISDLNSVRDFDIAYLDGYVGPAQQDPWVTAARERGVVVSSLACYLVTHARTRTMGVTGTAGKSTVTGQVIHILRNAGFTVHAVTDGGAETQFVPNYELVDALPDMDSGILIAELSSQGLALAETSPDIAVVTNLSPDHIADHGSFEAYVDAKLNIVRHQDAAGWAVLPSDESTLALFQPFCSGRVATHGVTDGGGPTAIFVRSGVIVGRFEGTEFEMGDAPSDQIALENALAATAAALIAGVDPAAISPGLRSAPRMRFRREPVFDERGLRAINDGLAATPTKARAGLESMIQPVIWIAGGFATFRRETLPPGDSLIEELRELAVCARERVRAAFIFGPGGPSLIRELERAGVPAVRTESLDAAVTAAAGAAACGDIVLFAPAMYVPPDDRASFDVLIRQALM